MTEGEGGEEEEEGKTKDRSVPDRSDENTLLKVRIVTYIPYGSMNFLNWDTYK